MNDAQARNAVILGGLVSAGAITLGAVSKGELPKPRRLLAGGIVFVALAALADTQPRLAGPAVGLVTVAVVLANGADALAGVQRAATSSKPLGAKPVPSTAPALTSAASSAPAGAAGGGSPLAPAGSSALVAPPSAGGKSAPIAGRWRIIGTPYGGTHTRGNWESDNALDIAAPMGTPVLAIHAGTIGSRIGPLSSSEPALAGLRVNLEGSNGVDAYYAHLSRLVVRAGQRVVAGQVLGYSGAANGVNHLHFAVSPPNRPQTYYS